MAVEIKYNDTTIANVEAGKTATLTCKDKKMKTDITIAASVIEDSATPVEVATADEMTALLETAEIGAIFKYVGETTDAYENGALYVVEEEVNGYTVEITTNNSLDDAPSFVDVGYSLDDGGTWTSIKNYVTLDGVTQIKFRAKTNGDISYIVWVQDNETAEQYIPNTYSATYVYSENLSIKANCVFYAGFSDMS